MDKQLYNELKKITPEEERILQGNKTIEKELYISVDAAEDRNVIEAKKLLEAGKLIQVRKHTRFVHFPEHTHDYVEMIYMCSGSTHHRVNGYDVILNQAAYLLKTTSMSVLEIGMAVGYENQSYFHRIFQKQFGTTPRKYRVQMLTERSEQ